MAVVPRPDGELARRPVRRRSVGTSHSACRYPSKPGATVCSVTTAHRPSGRQARFGRDAQAIQVLGARAAAARRETPVVGRRAGAPGCSVDAGPRAARPAATIGPTMADQLALPLDATADRLPGPARPAADAGSAAPRGVRLGAAPVRAVVGRRRGRWSFIGPARAAGDGRRPGRRRRRCRPDRSTPRAGRHGRARRGALRAARRRARRGRDGRARRCGGPRSHGSRASAAARPRSSPSTSCISMAGRCSTSRWSSGARPCAGSCARATRSSRSPRSRRRAGPCSRPSSHRASPG